MSTPSPGTVTTHLELRLVLAGDRGVPVGCELDYDAEAPYELRATFTTADGEVTWVFARDLVRQGLVGPTGDGDVVVWPSRTPGGDVVCLALSSPSGRALLEAERPAVQEFLARTDRLVPPGAESERIDLDDLVSRLLGDGTHGPEAAGV